MGKGSVQRPTNAAQFRENHDRIYGEKTFGSQLSLGFEKPDTVIHPCLSDNGMYPESN